MPPSPVVRGTSSQRALRNAARKCSVEGCDGSLGTGSARGMCYRHYHQAAAKEKAEANPLESRIPSAREDSSITLPRRKPFEWLGSLQESISAIAQEE